MVRQNFKTVVSKLVKNSQFSILNSQFCAGYTMVEMMIVVAVIAFIATIGFYGIRSAQESQKLNNAQKEFISNLRAQQNYVTANFEGTNIRSATVYNGASYYELVKNGARWGIVPFVNTVNLPNGVTLSAVDGDNQSVSILCFNHPYLIYPATNTPGSDCTFWPGAVACHYFSCKANGNSAVSPITITMTNGMQSRQIKVEGSGTQITRIYGN